MKLETVKKSLELYLTTVTNETERIEIQNSINECQQQIDRYQSRDIWEDDIYVITPNSLVDLLNFSTYDEYGKLRRTNGSVTLEQYRELVNKQMFLDLTDNSLQLGLDVIGDLWSDNEEYGDNNPDGTFNM
jgi:hypothetical protein